jgi:HEAT repeat protein
MSASLHSPIAARVLAFVAVAAAPLSTLGAQSLTQRVDAVRDGVVQFNYPARAGVCGNGRSYISYAPGSFVGSNVSVVNGVPSEGCEPGPVRVIIARAGGMTTAIDAFVGGPATVPPGVSDLGAVAAAQAHEYLLEQASRLDGKPGRDAIFPAMLAEGATASAPLIALARDRARPLETRRSAISWIGRMSEAPGRADGPAVASLADMARARDDNPSVRQQAVSTLARLGQGEGVPTLIEMAQGKDDAWLAEQSATQLSRSGDPRARQWLRTAVQAADTPDPVRQLAIRGLGGQYATAQDMTMLRQAYARLSSTSAKERLVSTLATLGGRENVEWLLGIARSTGETTALRRQAALAAEKAGASAAELAQLYDSTSDRDVKYAFVEVYARRGTDEAVSKLISIAKDDPDSMVRRRAITRLSRSTDPRAIQALQEIIQP